jgi:hypothetical protein
MSPPTGGTGALIQAVRETHNRTRGRLFGAVEAAGLPIRQENALKGLIRQTTYDSQIELEQMLRERKT